MPQSGDISMAEIKVYSYNVQACHPMKDIFARCPEVKEMKEKKLEEARINWIKTRIIKKITFTDKNGKEQTKKNVIFCLQEVCGNIKNRLNCSFRKRGYTMIDVSNKSCEAIAFYNKSYEPTRISDYRPSITREKNRQQYFIFAMMKMREGQAKGKVFCIGSCHLPSRITTKHDSKLIHAGNVVRHFQKFCDGSEGVLAGDFAMRKGKVAYNAVTRGVVKDLSEGSGYFVNTATKAMNSAYYKLNRDEPPGTLVYGEKTTDYIFCTDNVYVSYCDKVESPAQNGSQASRVACPTEMHPSNHAIIGAKLKVLLSEDRVRSTNPTGRMTNTTRHQFH